MEGPSPLKIDAIVQKIMEGGRTFSSLDDLFEFALSRFLDIHKVRQVEIWLFNQRNERVLAAEGRQFDASGSGAPRLLLQSWAINTTTRHSTCRVHLPDPFWVTSIPLQSSGKLLGHLNIQMNQVQAAPPDLLAGFHLIGNYLAVRINEILLQDEIGNLSSVLQHLSADYKNNQQRITALSKELYAICAVSTRINQSLDLRKSIRKSMTKLKTVFRASGVMVYLRNAGQSRPCFFTAYQNGKNPSYSSRLIEHIETIVLKDFFTQSPTSRNQAETASYSPRKLDLNHSQFKSMTIAPMRAQKKLVGVLVLLYEVPETFSADNLRLLCGIGDIMGLAVENMNLYRQSQYKKKTAAFLVESISRFNEKMDLQKTLISIVEKSAQLIGRHSHVYLFTETPIALIYLRNTHSQHSQPIITAKRDNIMPALLSTLYEQMRYHKRPSLISNMTLFRRIRPEIRHYFEAEGIHSVVSVPLTLSGKSVGLLLLCGRRGQRTFDQIDLSVAEALGSAASVAIENSRAYTSSMNMNLLLEKKICEKTTQIQKIQERLSIRVENRNDIIFRVNNLNRFVFVNKAMEMLSDLSREEMYRKNFSIDQIVASEDRKRVKSCFQIVLNGILPMIKDLVYRHINTDGTDRLISLTIYPEMDADGCITGVEGVGRDITEKKRLEEELKKARDLALLGEFSSAIAHQIRNPLGNILMGTKLLQRTLGMEHPDMLRQCSKGSAEHISPVACDQNMLRQIFRNLADGINNLNHVVTKLVEYTKTLKLNRSCQQVPIIIEENLLMLDAIIISSGIQVEKFFDHDLPPISVDAVLISQVFQNIIHNAIQVMPLGGRLIVSAVREQSRQENVLISISDEGTGIAHEDMDKIFHPFYTTKDTGIGLGLALAYRIVEAHNGKIWACLNPCPHILTVMAEAQHLFVPPQQGATFHLLLAPDADSENSTHSRGVNAISDFAG